MNAKSTNCVAKSGLLLLLFGATAWIAGACASGCVIADTCESDGTCPTAAAEGDASIAEAASDAPVESDALDIPENDALDIPESPLEGATDAADASPIAPFLGSFTRTSTADPFVCPYDYPDGDTAIPSPITVTFRAGPGPTDAGQVDLLFDDGIKQCALALFVDHGVARLVSAPQSCNLNAFGAYREYTAVQVTSGTVPLPFREIFTDHSTACQSLIDGILTPENE